MEFAVIDFADQPDVELEIIKPQDGNVRCYPVKDEALLPEQAVHADAIMIGHDIRLGRTTLARMDHVKIIVRIGVGYDNIDVVSAGELGIPVANVPDYGTNDVADHAFALLLAAARNIISYNDLLIRDPHGHFNPYLGAAIHRLTDTTLGIIGLGRIGTAVAIRAKAFGMHVRFYDPYIPDGYDKAIGTIRVSSSEELFARSDYVSVHAPFTSETAGMIGAPLFQHARENLVLINTARGGIVDLRAVYDALHTGKIRAFAADVLEEEPPDPMHPLIRAYHRREPWIDGRVILTPHAAFYAEESRHEMRAKAALQALEATRGMAVRNCVNLEHLRDPRCPVHAGKQPK